MSGVTSVTTKFRTTRSTTWGTGRSVAFRAPGRPVPTRRSAPAGGPARTSSSAAFISSRPTGSPPGKGRHEGIHHLVHGPLGRGEVDDREHRRARARVTWPARRVPRRRRRPDAPLQGARLLEGGPRHEP